MVVKCEQFIYLIVYMSKLTSYGEVMLALLPSVLLWLDKVI